MTIQTLIHVNNILMCIPDVTWQGQEARLALHYDHGFTLSDTRPEDGRKSQIFWHFPYEKLRMSADDGMRLLWFRLWRRRRTGTISSFKMSSTWHLSCSKLLNYIILLIVAAILGKYSMFNESKLFVRNPLYFKTKYSLKLIILGAGYALKSKADGFHPTYFFVLQSEQIRTSSIAFM